MWTQFMTNGISKPRYSWGFFCVNRVKPWKRSEDAQRAKRGRSPLISVNEMKRDLICSWLAQESYGQKTNNCAQKWHNATTRSTISFVFDCLCEFNNRVPNSNILTHAISSLISLSHSFFLVFFSLSPCVSLAILKLENTLDTQPHNCIQPVDHRQWFTMNHFYFSWPLKCDL